VVYGATSSRLRDAGAEKMMYKEVCCTIPPHSFQNPKLPLSPFFCTLNLSL
jgi:hypothetical protein